MHQTNFGGVDVGRKGGLALVDCISNRVETWEMPPEQSRGINLEELWKILEMWPKNTVAAVEWNTCLPHEVPDFSMRFGIQSGEIRAMLFACRIETILVPPQVWMQKLGLWGKKNDPGLQYRMAFVREHYPAVAEFLVGPRGGIRDGLLEALLIAHYVRLMRGTPLGNKSGPKPPRFKGLPPE